MNSGRPPALSKRALHAVGPSECPEVDEPFMGEVAGWSCQEMVEDILAIFDALGWERAHLLGVSMGAGMAQFLACSIPAGSAS
jgi:pimeloyl-ACP methyl ester carboxylesterase